ncbi:hypothetical protein HDU91_005301, partial [Kappamyces sp. JEL0680]
MKKLGSQVGGLKDIGKKKYHYFCNFCKEPIAAGAWEAAPPPKSAPKMIAREYNLPPAALTRVPHPRATPRSQAVAQEIEMRSVSAPVSDFCAVVLFDYTAGASNEISLVTNETITDIVLDREGATCNYVEAVSQAAVVSRGEIGIDIDVGDIVDAVEELVDDIKELVEGSDGSDENDESADDAVDDDAVDDDA